MINEYISKVRVERDGRLVAYEGEVMSTDEAKSRGLLDEPKAKASKKAAKPEQADEPDAEKADPEPEKAKASKK